MDDAHASLPSKLEFASGPDAKIPEVTILVLTLNEEITIEAFLDWCQEGIALVEKSSPAG